MLSLRDVFRMVRRNLLRRKLRTGLTVLGVALAVMLLVGIEAFAAGMDAALTSGDKARTLVVYRENRYCPQTSFLPERYTAEIEEIAGVDSVLPVRVFLNNCRTNLDMITFHGAPVDELLATRQLELLAGSKETFRREQDSALVGEAFAKRRNLDVGSKFQFGGIVVKVAGIFRSADATQSALVLTHLDFLQRAGPVDRLGVVTQFEVKVDDPAQVKSIAKAIDQRLATAEEPTHTRPMAAFLERATRDLREILRFGRIFGAACVLVVVVLVSNTIYMAVNERRREFGVLRAIGFKGPHLLAIVLAESAAIAAVGSTVGLVAMWALLEVTSVGVGVEGVQVGFVISPAVVLSSLALTAGAAILASALPATQAARTNVVRALRGGA